MARPTGVGRALATCEIPIDALDGWLAVAMGRRPCEVRRSFEEGSSELTEGGDVTCE